MREGLIEATVVPRNPLDVLAQQIVAMAAAAGDEGVAVDDAARAACAARWTVRRARAPPARERARHARRAATRRDEFAELRPRIVWDRTGRHDPRPPRRPRSGRDQRRHHPRPRPVRRQPAATGARVGELDEEMVYEARAGRRFLLGATSWRIEEITARPRARHARRRARPAPCRSGTATAWAGRASWARRSAPSRAGRVDAGRRARCSASTTWTSAPPRNLLAFLREQQAATGVVPCDRTIVVERFRDEIGDWRLCVLTPFGGRVHAAWALALTARIRDALRPRGRTPSGPTTASSSTCPTPTSRPAPSLVADRRPTRSRSSSSASSAAARCSARASARTRPRALLIPRAYPGRRTPLWQQRLKAQSLLEVARRYRAVPDRASRRTASACATCSTCPGSVDVLRGAAHARARRSSRSRRRPPRRSPRSLLFDYVATYMYEGDTPAPSAGRRRSRSTATCCASCSARRSCAS